MGRISVTRGTPTIADEYCAELTLIGEERREDRTPVWKRQEKFHARVLEDAGDLLLIFKDGSAYHYATRQAYTAEEVKTVFPHVS